jgi:hypothetical protein
MLVLPPSPRLLVQRPALAVLEACKSLTESLTQKHTQNRAVLLPTKNPA